MKKVLINLPLIIVALSFFACGGGSSYVPMRDQIMAETRDASFHYDVRAGETPVYSESIPAEALPGSGLVIGALSFAAEPIYLDFNGEGKMFYAFETVYGQQIFATVLPAGRYVLHAYEQWDAGRKSVANQKKFSDYPVRKFTVLPNSVVNLGYILDQAGDEPQNKDRMFQPVIEVRRSGEDALLMRRALVSADPNESEMISAGKSNGSIYKLVVPGLNGLRYYIANWQEYALPPPPAPEPAEEEAFEDEAAEEETAEEGSAEEDPFSMESEFEDDSSGEESSSDEFAEEEEPADEVGDEFAEEAPADEQADDGADDDFADDEFAEDDFGDFEEFGDEPFEDDFEDDFDYELE